MKDPSRKGYNIHIEQTLTYHGHLVNFENRMLMKFIQPLRQQSERDVHGATQIHRQAEGILNPVSPLPIFVDAENLYTWIDSCEAVSITSPPAFVSRSIPDTHFCYR